MASLDTIGSWSSSLETKLAVNELNERYPRTNSGGSISVCNNFNCGCKEKMALAQLNCKIHTGRSENITLEIGNDIIDIHDILNIYNKVTSKLMLFDKNTKYKALNEYISKNVSIIDPIKFITDKILEIATNNNEPYKNALYSYNVNLYKDKKIIKRSDLTLFVNNSKTFLEECLCYSDCISYYICHCYGNCNYY